MNYIVRKGIPNLHRTTDKRKQERVSVGSRTKQLKVVRNHGNKIIVMISESLIHGLAVVDVCGFSKEINTALK